MFVKHFWTTTYQNYFVDDQHENLMAGNSNITFELGNNETVDILLPYSRMDLAMDYRLIHSKFNAIRYFPLERATNPSQYTLRRTFLQEA